MRALPSELTERLSTGATTLCWCWRLTRRDGARMGFTDHDEALVFDGTTFEAAAGFTAGEVRDVLGLAVDDVEVEGAIASDSLSEADLAAGLYDDAGVEIFRVDWREPANRVLMRAGSLGEIQRRGPAFRAEVRGLSHYLQQPIGRLYQYGCDAVLGDTRCGVALDAPSMRLTTTIAAIHGERMFGVSGLDAYAADWMSRGLFRFTGGANAGRAFEIKRHTTVAGQGRIELWQTPAEPVAVGDAAVLTAGCDKQFSTCRDKFGNAHRFRGFPFMPGNGYVTRVGGPGRS